MIGKLRHRLLQWQASSLLNGTIFSIIQWTCLHCLCLCRTECKLTEATVNGLDTSVCSTAGNSTLPLPIVVTLDFNLQLRGKNLNTMIRWNRIKWESASCAQSSYRFPGFLQLWKTVFPVLEKYWNFIILLKILEKWEWTWKNEFSGKKKVLSWLLQHSFLLYRALPIKMYIWRNSGIGGLL